MNRAEVIVRWPLFEIISDPATNKSKGGWYYVKTEAGMIYVNDEVHPLNSERIEILDKSHALLAKTIILRDKFPNLYISLFQKEAVCWLKVDNRDREFLAKIDRSDESALLSSLTELNKKYQFVFQNPKEYFVCTCCKEEGVMDQSSQAKLNRLLDTVETGYLKFKDAGAGWFCSQCVDTDSQIKAEYDLSIKMGSSYYD